MSVIVPAFNAANTIGACLASLSLQSLSDMEVIVVDDGSTDETARLVRDFAWERAGRLVLVQQAHGGRAAARNTGVAASTGSHLGFVDADDEALPRMFELLTRRAHDTGADLVVCEYIGVSAATGELLFHATEGDDTLYGSSVAERPELLLQPGASLCNKLFERSLFERARVTFPEGRDFEDLAVAYRLTGEARRVEKVAEVLYRYHQGVPGSVMGSCDERYLQIVDALDVTNAHFLEQDRFDALRPQLIEVSFTHLIAGRYDDLLRFGCHKIRRAYTRAAFAYLDERFPDWRSHERVKRICRTFAKHQVSTHRALLDVYSDYLHATRSEGYGR